MVSTTRTETAPADEERRLLLSSLLSVPATDDEEAPIESRLTGEEAMPSAD